VDWLEPFRNRTERTIAVARLGLALAALAVIWLDPSQPARTAGLVYALLATYAFYAATLVAIAWQPRQPARWLGLVSHLADLGAFSQFMQMTEGPNSPFFLFFGFSLIAATLRWSWPGTLLTAAYALVVVGAYGRFDHVAATGEHALGRLVARVAWITVTAALLAAMAAHQDRLRLLLWRLAQQPATVRGDAEADLAAGLTRLAGLLAVPRLLFAASEPEEPWLDLLLLDRSGLHRSREPPDRFEPLVDPALAGAAFLAFDLDGEPVTLCRAAGEVTRWRGRPLHAELCRAYAISSVIALPVRAAGLEAWLLLLDRPALTADDLLLGEVAAAQLAALLDQTELLRRLQASAAAEARIAVARDLHDGVLQALAGTALQLEAAAQRLDQQPEAARLRLVAVREALQREQRELRRFIELLGPTATAPGGARPLAPELELLTHHLARQWGVELASTVEPAELLVERRLADGIARLIAEAVANAARHGAARSVRIALAGDAAELRLVIADDGHGFAWRGRRAIGPGAEPRSLAARVRDLGGRLVVDSGQDGARLEITLPLWPPAAGAGP
jgi:signal transduction histidine kinase